MVIIVLQDSNIKYDNNFKIQNFMFSKQFEVLTLIVDKISKLDLQILSF